MEISITKLLAPLAFGLGLAGCGSNPPAIAQPEDFHTQLKQSDTVSECIRVATAKREKKANEPAKVGVKHVLVKWKESKRAAAGVTRSRQAACERAMEARDKLRDGADFADVVKTYSDEAGAATRGGSLGTVERKEVAPEFADAAFELDVGQMSDVVETEFGFHVIMRTE